MRQHRGQQGTFGDDLNMALISDIPPTERGLPQSLVIQDKVTVTAAQTHRDIVIIASNDAADDNCLADRCNRGPLQRRPIV